ncbi:hypothetical protein JKA74_11185 [Marivirga sp. S37H4]|uniref:Uncharacterized protein n=1 Tax=Marivirga aurantiaca TaxID=2802615 RepID=A0A935C9H9_9BACT|nr:hypothetical protein [Marivirga aurantiaca]MBK6265602.1 hypothetical protein [Marivirga aurantiaca]
MSDQNQLLERSKQYEREISEQVREFTGKAEDWGKTALMVAGGAFVAYQLVKLFSGSRSKSKGKVYRETDEDETEIKNAERIIIRRDNSSPGLFDLIKVEMSGLLLAIAKEKILEFLSQIEASRINASEEENTK